MLRWSNCRKIGWLTKNKTRQLFVYVAFLTALFVCSKNINAVDRNKTVTFVSADANNFTIHCVIIILSADLLLCKMQAPELNVTGVSV